MQIILLKNFLFLINLRPIKRSKNIDPLVELPFYEQLSITKTDQA